MVDIINAPFFRTHRLMSTQGTISLVIAVAFDDFHAMQIITHLNQR